MHPEIKGAGLKQVEWESLGRRIVQSSPRGDPIYTLLGYAKMSRILKLFTSQPIANSGSTARDHLANERTFLSWTRTGLGFIALGVALAKLDALEDLSPALKHDHGDLTIPSAALVGSGTGCLSYGTVRYYLSMNLLQKGLFRPNFAGVALVAVTSGAVAGGGIYLVVKQERGRVDEDK